MRILLSAFAALAVMVSLPRDARAETIVQERFGCHAPEVTDRLFKLVMAGEEVAFGQLLKQPRQRRVPVVEARRSGPAREPDGDLRVPRPDERAGSLLLDAAQRDRAREVTFGRGARLPGT